VIKDFDTLGTTHIIPVLGLYAGNLNFVEITLFNVNGENLGSSAITIKTAALSVDLPVININASSPNKKAGMTLVSYFGYQTQSTPQKPFIFDEFGDVRWYLDFSASPVLKALSFDDGVERLQNGNLYFGDISSGAIYEVNMLGETLHTWTFPGYDFHHKVLEKPNGNFLVSVSKQGLSTVEDQVIEIARNSNQIIKVWDLRQSLQYDRTTLTADRKDWVHINAVAYDESDNTIIVSGRTQCVVKLDQNNKVVWIIAPHKGWGIAGDGTDLNTKLLNPLDAAGNPITDPLVINGTNNHREFEWNWCQHAVKPVANGYISMFDNGDNRNYVTSGPYSRAVEYKIDQANMTIKQIWEYGKERGAETYSKIVSDVDFHQDVNHIIFSPGDVNFSGKYGKVIEVDYNSSAVLFEATIYPPSQYPGSITFHRTERLSLYP